MSKLERIATFIKVVEENGFAAAARKLQLSTAAISRQIGALEAELGVQLLQRTTRQLSLTEIGKQYYEQCKKTLSDLAMAEATIAGSQTDPIGTLSITSSRYFAEEYLIPRLPEFMAQNPNLCIDLELAERFPDLDQEGIDILFGVSMEGPPDLVRKRVKSTRYVLCASPSYLEKFGIPNTPAELSQHCYITHKMRRPDNVITFKDSKEIYIEPMLRLNDCHAMRECAILGLGIVKLHDYMVTDDLRDQRLVEILTEYKEPQQSVYLYYQQTRHLQPKIRRFIDFYTQN